MNVCFWMREATRSVITETGKRIKNYRTKTFEEYSTDRIKKKTRPHRPWRVRQENALDIAVKEVQSVRSDTFRTSKLNDSKNKRMYPNMHIRSACTT